MDKLSNIFAAREDMAKAMIKLERVFTSGTIDKEVKSPTHKCRMTLPFPCSYCPPLGSDGVWDEINAPH